MKSIIRRSGASSGFSLIEVLIAVVVLATGLLALAALQGSLTRSSADAKVRGRVAAMLTARMDQLRSLGYGNAALNTGTVTTPSTPGAIDPCDGDATDWLDCTRIQAGLSALTVTQVTHIWSSAIGASNFTVDRVPATDEPEFKRIVLTATWTDANGSSHSIGASSDTSALAQSNELLPPITSESGNSKGPIVRQLTPVVDGMIPIAIGGGSDTAATNPKPVIVGSNSAVAETSYNVLTYHNETGSVVRVQQRVETRVVACSCKYGAEASSAFLAQDYRPTYWDGSQYKVPEPVATADDVVNSGKNTEVSGQSDVCDQCCRDHNDPATLAADKAKFDPKRWNADSSEAQRRFVTTNLTSVVPNTNNKVYNDACRVIRVDGFWRVASDANQEQFGLLRTKSDYVEKIPDPLAADYYEEYVIDYLTNRFVSGSTTPAGTQYDAFSGGVLNDLVNVNIKPSASPTESRYLHARGLYVDYIEPEAKKVIDDAITGCKTTPKINCALPHVPFSTVNLTDLANFDDNPDNVLNVQNAVGLRGQVNGLTTAANNAFADAVTSARISNTGLTGSLPIDDADLNLATVDGDRSIFDDRQKFTISSAGSGSGSSFTVSLDPLASPLMSDGIAVNDPAVDWKVAGSGLGCRQTADTASPNPYTCKDAPLGGAAQVIVSKYNYADPDIPTLVTCPNADPNGVLQTVAVSPTPRPVCKRFAVNSVTTSAGTIFDGYSVTANADKYNEMTTIDFTALLPNATIVVGFAPASDLPGTIQQCNYAQNSDLTWSVSSIDWTDPCK